MDTVWFGDLEAIVCPSVPAPISHGDQKETTTTTDQSTLLLDVDTGTQQECSESNNGGVNAEKKLAWNKPSNVATSAEVASVIMAESWPALSESNRSSPKPLDMQKSYSDGSIYPAQLDVPNNFAQDSSSRDNLQNGGLAQDSSSRDNLQNGGQRLHPGNHHRPQRNSFRRANGSSRFHGNGSVNNGYGGRHSNQDRGNHDWNPNRRFLGRDAHIPPQRGLPPLMRGPPPLPLSFVPAPRMPIHPLGMPAAYPGMSVYQGPTNPFTPFSLGPPMLPMFNELSHLQLRDNDELRQLRDDVVSQVDYYFSENNLIKDIFLRQRMDDQGWVPIQLIAGFNKVKQLTNDVQFLLVAIRSSSIVEVEGEKVRRRNDWRKWLIPASLK